MNRTLLFGIVIFLVLVGISLLGSDGQAIAGHGCHGCGGDYSCYGRSVYRDCHGCWGRSYLHHSPVVSRRCHGCSGYAGRHGCGGAYSCYGRSVYRDCHGCWGRSYLYHSPVVSRRCHGCGGCFGGMHCHGENTVIERHVPTETPVEREQSAPVASDGDGTIKINLNVPSDATVFVNGRSTKSTGSQRSYVSKGLLHGHEYMFTFRVEIYRNGQTRTRHKTITTSTNEVHDVRFDFDATHVAVVSDR